MLTNLPPATTIALPIFRQVKYDVVAISGSGNFTIKEKMDIPKHVKGLELMPMMNSILKNIKTLNYLTEKHSKSVELLEFN